jgi:hypothetical protein
MHSLSPTALFLGLCVLLSLSVSQAADNPQRPTPKVFAHYMVCIPRAGSRATVADYMAEMREAQARGIDGFTLNCGDWSRREPYYKARTTLLYEAAKQLDTGFQLMISADYAGLARGAGLTLEETKDMIVSFRDHPNQFKWDGKPVLSTYAGQGADNKHGQEVIDFLNREFPDGKGGRTVVYVPYYGREGFTQADVDRVFDTFPGLDGFFTFGAAGYGPQLAKVSALLADKWVGAGKIYMASVTPFYRGFGGNYRVFETRGFEGMAEEWEAAISHRATWVEIVTWNDWAEATYVCPFGAPQQTELWNGQFGKELSHTGFLDAMRYYVAWYHRGAPPPIERDALFYAYRLHPKSVQGRVGPREEALGRPDRANALVDSVFVMCLLKSPAKLTIHSGDASQTFDVAAGEHRLEMPFALGKQRFVVERNGQTVLDKTGEHEITSDSWSNFNVFAGSAAAD